MGKTDYCDPCGGGGVIQFYIDGRFFEKPCSNCGAYRFQKEKPDREKIKQSLEFAVKAIEEHFKKAERK